MIPATMKARLPLHITISTLFITLIVIFGAVLTWQNYSKTSDIIRSSANKVYEQITREMLLDIKRTYAPIIGMLNLLGRSPLTGIDDPQNRLALLGSFAQALSDNPALSAIQVGYQNGDYFIVRSLNSMQAREVFSAPAQALFITDDIRENKDGTREQVRAYYDKALVEIGGDAPMHTDYDPRTRSWYKAAYKTPRAVTPYLFFFTRQVGTTVTLKTSTSGVVIAADVTLEQLSETLAKHQITPASEAVLVGADGRAIAYKDTGKLIRLRNDTEPDISHITELGSAVLAHVGQGLVLEPGTLDFVFNGKQWTGSIAPVTKVGDVDLHVLMISPVEELLREAINIRWSSVIATLVVLLISIPVIWYVAERISDSIRQLAAEAGNIGRFDFETPIQTHSFIREVDTLAGTMAMMKATIKQFVTLINSLAGDKDFDSLLRRISQETMRISQADGVVTYLVDDDETFLEPGTLCERQSGNCDITALPRLALSAKHALVKAVSAESFSIIEISIESTQGLEPLLATAGAETLTIIALPLRNRRNESIGILCLLYGGQIKGIGDGRYRDQLAFIQALSGFSAVTLESRHLLKMQEALLNAFIKLIAGAIDAKSPYTGGHCQRVPALTRMLAEAACQSNELPFADFKLSDDEWEALDIASWLHDCGKVTTPEYVVDKATKLETIYDRIHEVRMRFEVLKRDAEVRYWEQLAAGGNRETLRGELEGKWKALDDDFRFVAECNLGGEFMAPEKIQRLHRIAERTWTRTLDDRIGISWEELQRKERYPAPWLPVQEPLLANKPEHLIERDDVDKIPADNPWGFRLDVPEYKYNRGELYNLETGRGTLSAEERYKINDHIVQTIIMLEKLPYPKHLRGVPGIAGGHHETMNGTGYPKRLSREDMPLTTRMMAIADIFEALTASDRPYKKAKTLSESIRILSFMRNDNHVDPDLFELFLTSKIWLEYGRKYLDPEQIDEVDVSQYLRTSE